MRDLRIKLVALLSVGLAVSSTFADCDRGGYGGGYSGGYYPSADYSIPQQSESSDGLSQIGEPDGGEVSSGRALEPFHSTHNPFPTDNFFIVSLKEYGTSDAAPFIAAFNGMQPSDSLANVARLHMPSISKDGRMSQSKAPLSDADLAAQTAATNSAAPVQLVPARATAAAPSPGIASGGKLTIGQSSQPNGGQVSSGRALEPIHSTHNPLPTDSFYIVSLKEYGTSDATRFIAAFNGMKPSDSLVNVARLHLPSISKDGKMSQSKAPLSDADLAAQAATTAAPLPSIPSGSTLKLGGQSLGDKGSVRLKVGGLSLPAEVVEWSTTSATVRLPSLEVTAATKAELEVVRTNGTLAAKSGLNLMPTNAGPAKTVAKK